MKEFVVVPIYVTALFGGKKAKEAFYCLLPSIGFVLTITIEAHDSFSARASKERLLSVV